ncbi:MAG: hypothetical protein ACTHZ9_11250 [Leucobacter sp.]
MVIWYRTTASFPVERLRRVERFRKARAVHVRQAVADLETRILDSDREPVPCAGATEREHVPARLQHPQRFDREVQTRRQVVPLAAHEPQPVRRVGDN